MCFSKIKPICFSVLQYDYTEFEDKSGNRCNFHVYDSMGIEEDSDRGLKLRQVQAMIDGRMKQGTNVILHILFSPSKMCF